MRIGSTRRMRAGTVVTIPAVSIALLAVLGLWGCAGTDKKHVLPEDGPSMLEIYDQHFDGMQGAGVTGARAKLGQPVQGRTIHAGSLDLAGYTRTAQTEIDKLFPELPNPTLVMYVYPHLTEGEHAPVPGYSTAFRMYEGTEYALPGEAPLR